MGAAKYVRREGGRTGMKICCHARHPCDNMDKREWMQVVNLVAEDETKMMRLSQSKADKRRIVCAISIQRKRGKMGVSDVIVEERDGLSRSDVGMMNLVRSTFAKYSWLISSFFKPMGIKFGVGMLGDELLIVV